MSRNISTASLQAITEAAGAVRDAADVVSRDKVLDEAIRVQLEATLRRMARLLVEVPR